MEAAYRHSKTFSQLKTLQETIPNNLTSHEYLSTLDSLLYKALEHIIQSTRFVDVMISKLLAWQSTNPKRKASANDRKLLPQYVCLYLLADEPEEKFKLYRSIEFDRGITVEIIRRWLSIVSQYETISNNVDLSLNDRQRLHRISLIVDVVEGENLFAAYMQVKFWFEKALYFKSLILEKYTRLCLNTAQQDYVKYHHRIDLEDIIQVYLMAASKAIDKCNTGRGVLTTHIQHWLMSARNTVVKNYLEDNSVTRSTDDLFRKDEFETVVEGSEQVDSIEFFLERQGTIERVRQLAKFFDKSGCARLSLGIGEYVSKEMREKLELHKLTMG